MRQVTDLKEIQGIALEIFEAFHTFCKENKIEYFMAYGTLIGTIRHQGFIPWDDDIDVWMKREAYCRFVKLFPAWGAEKGLYLNASETTENYNRIFAKVCKAHTKVETLDRDNRYPEGFFIDIFVLDGCPNQPLKRFLRITRLQTLRNLVTLSAYGADKLPNSTRKQKFYGILAKPLRGLNQRKVVKKYEAVASKSGTAASDYLLVPIRKSKGRALQMPAEWFASAIEKPFEHMTALAPVGFDSILRMIFGDYMQLPPEEQRKPGHAAKFFVEA